MLNLLKQLQSVILTLLRSFSNNEDTPLCFPFTSIFDAVTPYYPIKFTPPPNDPWGITKQGLHGSLMDVLTYSTHHVSNETVRTGLDVDNNMTLLVTNLFLERLHIEEHPYDDDDNEDSTTTQDRIDTIQDLFELLLPPFEHDQLSLTEKQMCISLLLLPYEVIYQMSSIIRRCHEDAAISVVSSTNIEDKKNYKRLADLCRNFANRFAYELEILLPIQRQNNTILKKTSWESFVLCTTKELADVIASSPQSVKGRVAIAYIASLSACGGVKTLRLCLETYMPVLLRLLKNGETLNNDEEQMSTAANGIGACFSSCKVSMEQISTDQIVIHPHPLHAYASEVIDLLCKVIVREKSSDQLKGAAIKALESVLVSCPHEIMTAENIDSVKKTILNIAQCMIDYLSTSNHNEPSEDWKSACSRILGTSIGRSIRNKQYDPDSQIVNAILFEYDNEISEFVKESLLPKLLVTCTQKIDTADERRLDWKVMAYACEIGEKHVSELILIHMFEALTITIQSKSQDEKHLESVTSGLSFILKHGGTEPMSAFHNQGLQLKLIDILSCPPCTNQDVGISNLVLPEVRRKTQADAEKVVSQ